MSRRTTTRPEVRLTANGATFWLSSIVPQGWGELEHSTRTNGSWDASWTIPANPLTRNWRHPVLVYGALVEVTLGPVVIWSGVLDEPDWDSGTFSASGASREAETTLGLDGSGNSSTAPNTVIDAAIAAGDLTWTRVGDFGTTAVGDANGGLVSLSSILDAWALKNNSRWYVNARRQLVIDPVDETTADWLIVPGSGVLGSSSDERVDRIYARYIDSATGQRATVFYPTTGTKRVKKPLDLTDRGAMTSTAAQGIAQAKWTELQGRSGWTNGLTVSNGQVTTVGGGTADLALIKAGDTVCLLGVPDVRGVPHNTNVVLAETAYNWEDDEIQLNPVGLAARDQEGALEQIGNLAVDALNAAGGSRDGDTGWIALSTSLAGTTARYRVRAGHCTVEVGGNSTLVNNTYTVICAAGSIPAAARPTATEWKATYGAGYFGTGIAATTTGEIGAFQGSGANKTGDFFASITYPAG